MGDLGLISPANALPLRFLTHNIRYATKAPFPGEKRWPHRKPLLCAQLHYHTRFLPSSIIFLQEVLHGQLLDIHSSLQSTHTSWQALGVGRDDGKTAGEYAPILFREDVWELVLGSYEVKWLSESGDVGKRGWDAASVRIVTVCVLQHREGGQKVLAMNTHLDDQGVVARRESAKLIVELCESRRGDWDVDVVVVGGDLNSEVDGEAYEVFKEYEASRVRDVRSLVGQEEGESIAMNENTFTGFNGKGDGEEVKRIDFLFLGMKREKDLVETVKGYAVLPNRFEDGVFLSDHRAVVADLMIRTKDYSSTS